MLYHACFTHVDLHTETHSQHTDIYMEIHSHRHAKTHRHTQTHRYVRGDTPTCREAETHIDTQTRTQRLMFLSSLIATLPSKGGEIDGHVWN